MERNVEENSGKKDVIEETALGNYFIFPENGFR